MKESALIVDHRKKWLENHPNGWFYKIQDGLGLGGQKPFDVVALHEGHAYCIEFKLHKTHQAFPLSKIDPHQIRCLRESERAGAIATVFIGVRFLMDIDTQARLGLRVRRISVDIELPVQEIVELVRAGVKSIPVLPYIVNAQDSTPRKKAVAHERCQDHDLGQGNPG